MGRHDGVRNPLDNGLPVNSRRSVAPHRTPAPGPLLRLVQDGAHGADDPEVVGSGPSHAEEEVCGAAGLGSPGRPVPLVDPLEGAGEKLDLRIEVGLLDSEAHLLVERA